MNCLSINPTKILIYFFKITGLLACDIYKWFFKILYFKFKIFLVENKVVFTMIILSTNFINSSISGVLLCSDKYFFNINLFCQK